MTPNVDRAQLAALVGVDLTLRVCHECDAKATVKYAGHSLCDACYRTMTVDEDDGDSA